jgi:single-strand DNA-binding protein
MTDLNRVQLIGRLTRDPELRQTNGGTSYCRFGIANNRNYTSNGERREEVSFFNCQAWGKTAEIINQYCKKGKQVAVDGRLQQRSWEDKEGRRQSSVDVVVESLQMLGSPTQDNSHEPQREWSEPAPPYGGDTMDDDDIPF